MAAADKEGLGTLGIEVDAHRKWMVTLRADVLEFHPGHEEAGDQSGPR
jgi:hypothetical protein